MTHPYTALRKLFSPSHEAKRNIVFVSILFLAPMWSAMKQIGVAQEVNLKASGSISGRVTIQGKPAPGLELALLPAESDLNRPLAIITTDEEGRYHFANLPANHYWVKVRSREYVSLDGSKQDAGRSVSVADGSIVRDADLDLILGGVLSGRIIDVDGNPVSGEYVHLFDVTDNGPSTRPMPLYAADFKSNSNGEYRITGIPAGRYLVGVGVDIARSTGAVMDKNDWMTAQGRVGTNHYFEQMFYPGTPKREEAPAIQISHAAEANGINLTVGRQKRSFVARGHVIDAQTGKPLPGKRSLRVMHRLANRGYQGTIADDQVSDDGSFEITGLLSERFFANVAFEGDSDLYSDKVEFQIEDADVNGLEIRAHRGFSISGVVDLEGETSAAALAKRAQLKLSASSPITGTYPSMHREVSVSADGTFKFVGMPLGPVEISASHCDTCKFFSLRRIEFPIRNASGGMQAAEKGWTDSHRLINVDRNIQGMRVVLGYNGGSIRCLVNVIGTLPLGVRLMVLIDSGIGKGGWSGWRDVDANGQMLDTGLESGNYDLLIGDGSRRFTGTKRVTVAKNRETKVSFTIDASRIQKLH